MKSITKSITILFLTLLIMIPSHSFEQDVENIIKSKPFDYNGSVNFSLSYYNSQNNLYRGVPWQYALTANVSAIVYGIQFPFSIYINNFHRGFNHPFNYFGVSPSYKWIKIHLGHRSMSFSPYSLSGLTFWGIGVELNPGIFRFSALYGTFKNYIYLPNTDIEKTSLLPSYKRKGYGFKIGIGKEQTYLDLIYFKAKDDDKMDSIYNDTLNIFPKENLIVGLNGSVNIIKKIHIYFNSAVSLFTPDHTEESIIDSTEKYYFLTKLIDPKISTRIGFAGDAGIDFKIKSFLLGIKYQRIDPSYRSLGTNYFMNDMESLSVLNSFSAFKHRFFLSTRFGIARNNLLKNKISTNIRYIGSISGNIRFSKMFQLQVAYSNFQQEHSLEIVDINDTIQYAQTNQTFRISPVINWHNNTYSHSIRPVFSQSGFTTYNGLTDEYKDVVSTMASIHYNLSKKSSKISFNNSIYWRKYTRDYGANTNLLGGNIGVSKSFKDNKLTVNSSIGYNTSIGETLYDRKVLNINTRLSYKIFKRQYLSLSGYYINRSSKNLNDINEFRFYFQYSYSLK